MKTADELTADDIEKVLDTFQWAYPDRGYNRGELHLDRGSMELVLEVWVPDNDDPDSDEAKPLIVRVPLDDEDPEDQIRNLIHGYLCHEADEQMWFGNERPYHPHQEGKKP
jgi:hypothetical protein